MSLINKSFCLISTKPCSAGTERRYCKRAGWYGGSATGYGCGSRKLKAIGSVAATTKPVEAAKRISGRSTSHRSSRKKNNPAPNKKDTGPRMARRFSPFTLAAAATEAPWPSDLANNSSSVPLAAERCVRPSAWPSANTANVINTKTRNRRNERFRNGTTKPTKQTTANQLPENCGNS